MIHLFHSHKNLTELRWFRVARLAVCSIPSLAQIECGSAAVATGSFLLNIFVTNQHMKVVQPELNVTSFPVRDFASPSGC